MSDDNALPEERLAETPRDATRISRRHLALGISAVAVLVAAFFVFRSPGRKEKPPAEPPRIGSEMRAFEPAKVQPVNLQKPVATSQPMTEALQQGAPAPGDPLDRARAAPLISQQDQQRQQQEATRVAATQDQPGTPPNQESQLASKLHPTVLEASMATLLPHPAMTVTMGTLVPCTLNTAIDSSAPGIVTCTTQSDVLGTTGSVVLMERGTKVVGEYSSQFSQGQTRLFVLWNRAETPKHVVITLGSPAADAIGTAGFGGQIDNHFWQRFGGALLITFIDGAFNTLSAQASKNGSTNLSFGEGDQAATEALRNTVNIPPTLHKNQGETVSLMVARDLDFSSVYGLTLRAGIQ